MGYITDKFNQGEVHIRENVCGWYFETTDEFRPLMEDAMSELLEAGLITNRQVAATMVARNIHTEEFLTKYVDTEREFWSDPANTTAQREREFEMRAAFGEGEEVVNVFTGRRTVL